MNQIGWIHNKRPLVLSIWYSMLSTFLFMAKQFSWISWVNYGTRLRTFSMVFFRNWVYPMKVTPTTRRALTLISTFYYFCVIFCRSVFVILSLFGHCINCSSTIYCFWLPLWYLRTFLLSLIAEHINHVKRQTSITHTTCRRIDPLILMKTKMSNLLHSTRFWNNHHQIRSGKRFESQVMEALNRTVNIH